MSRAFFTVHLKRTMDTWAMDEAMVVDLPEHPKSGGGVAMNEQGLATATHTLSNHVLFAELERLEAPLKIWLHVRGWVDETNALHGVEWALEPWDDELSQAVYEASVPKELREAFTTLREMDDLEEDESYGHTESGLYDRETYLSFEGSKPERFDREPHTEISDIKLGRNFSLPVGCVVRDAKTGDKYICAVRPNWGGSQVWSTGFTADQELGSKWTDFDPNADWESMKIGEGVDLDVPVAPIKED